MQTSHAIFTHHPLSPFPLPRTILTTKALQSPDTILPIALSLPRTHLILLHYQILQPLILGFQIPDPAFQSLESFFLLS